jgi:Holliday junction resolvase RusA-like endonuclease
VIKFEFFVAGVPQSKQYRQTKFGVIYSKGKVVAWEKAIAMAALVAAGAGYKAAIGACSLWLDFYFPIPKSRKELTPGMPHLQDPDTTNLLKAAEDGLKRVLFVDDNLVWRTMCSKAWCEAGKEGVQVVVTIE